MGNKSKLTNEIIELIGAYFRQGHYLKFIAERLNIARSTLYKWIERGETEEGTLYRELTDTVRQCKAEGIMQLHNTVWQAAQGDPKLALEMLSRLAPEEYAKKTPLYDLERAAAEEILNNGNI